MSKIETRPTFTRPFEEAPDPKKPENKSKFPLKYRIIAGLAGIAVAGGAVGVGFAAASNGEKPAEGTSTSAPVEEPTPEASAPATQAPEAGTNNSEFTGEIMEQTLSIEEMDAITDISEFAKLPYADRLAYALYATPDMGIATPDNDLGYDDTSLIPGYYWQQLGGMSMNTTDKLKSEKAISALYYYTTNLQTGEIDDTYVQVINNIEQNAGEGVSNATTRVFEDSGKWQSGVDRSGKPIDFVNITSYFADTSSGEQVEASKTFQTVRQEVKLLNGDMVIFYPMAYGVDGKESPDTAYDY